MLGRSHRKLQVETLESRRVLNGDPTTMCLVQQEVELLAPPPPAGPHALDAVVITKSADQVRVKGTDSDAGRQIMGNSSDRTPILAADFNGDGVTDLLNVDSANNWWLYLNDGTQYLFEKSMGPGMTAVEILGTGDFNGDGRLDVVSYNPTAGELWVSINQVDGFDHQYWNEFHNPNGGWTTMHVGDFNGDGLPDVLAGEVGGHWWLAHNNGGTDFNNYRWGRFPDYNWIDKLDGEFTGDQIADVVLRAPDNTWWMWEGTANGFKNARYFGHWKMRDEWFDIQTGDFNGDQIDDVVGRTADGRMWVASTTVDGFRTWSWTTGWIHSADWTQMTIMDINGDGMADQVGHAKDDTWWYALSKGDRFHNHFWQKGGEGDFVAQGFNRDSPVDLSSEFGVTQSEVEVQRPPVVVADGYASVANGRIVLHGTFDQLAGLEVKSKGGFLSLDVLEGSVESVPLANPFPLGVAVVVVNRPNQTVVGVLGADRRIDVEGEVVTSVLYSGPEENAVDDLEINIGLGDDFGIVTVK